MATDNDLNAILSRIGQKSSYKYPGNEGTRRGRLKDRVALKAPAIKGYKVPYWIVVDVIARPDEPEMLRFGYYRESSSKWGSQTTLTSLFSIWKTTFVKAARQKKWFREFLDDVISALRDSRHGRSLD